MCVREKEALSDLLGLPAGSVSVLSRLTAAP